MNLKIKNHVVGLILPDFKSHYQHTITKTMISEKE